MASEGPPDDPRVQGVVLRFQCCCTTPTPVHSDTNINEPLLQEPLSTHQTHLFVAPRCCEAQMVPHSCKRRCMLRQRRYRCQSPQHASSARTHAEEPEMDHAHRRFERRCTCGGVVESEGSHCPLFLWGVAPGELGDHRAQVISRV